MKTVLKSFIRKTRGENQQHSERGKKFLNSRKKLEKKKKPRYWRCSLLTEDPLLPLAKELFCDQERADDFSPCSFTARLTASWKILPLLFIFYYLFAGSFFFFFSAQTILRLSIIIGCIYYYFLRSVYGNQNGFLGIMFSFYVFF